MSAVETFPLLLSDAEEESSAVAPCFSHEGINVRSPGVLRAGLGWVVLRGLPPRRLSVSYPPGVRP